MTRETHDRRTCLGCPVILPSHDLQIGVPSGGARWVFSVSSGSGRKMPVTLGVAFIRERIAIEILVLLRHGPIGCCSQLVTFVIIHESVFHNRRCFSSGSQVSLLFTRAVDAAFAWHQPPVSTFKKATASVLDAMTPKRNKSTPPPPRPRAGHVNALPILSSNRLRMGTRDASSIQASTGLRSESGMNLTLVAYTARATA